MSKYNHNKFSQKKMVPYCQSCFWTQPGLRRRFCVPVILVALLVASLVLSGVLIYQRLAEDKIKNIKLAEATTTLKMLGALLVNDEGNIQPEDPSIQTLAKELKTPDKIYSYVTGEIAFEPRDNKNLAASDVLKSKVANCAGKANLMCSLLLANGVKPRDCHVTVGVLGNNLVHAWLELKSGREWMILDSTTTLGQPLAMSKKLYYRQFKVKPLYEYNNSEARYCTSI